MTDADAPWSAGRRRSRVAQRVDPARCSTSRAIAAPKAPTPGSMTGRAARPRAGLAHPRLGARAARNAASTEAMLAVPVGTIDDLRPSPHSTPLVLGTSADPSSGHRLAQRQGQRLERGLGAVVVVAALEHVDVQRHARGGRQRDEEVRSGSRWRCRRSARAGSPDRHAPTGRPEKSTTTRASASSSGA